MGDTGTSVSPEPLDTPAASGGGGGGGVLPEPHYFHRCSKYYLYL
jgi:hypothetical protein